MEISENHKKMYRSPENINSQMQDVFDSFFSSLADELDSTEDKVIERLKTLEIEINPQIMHVFEAPLDKNDFKDLVKQLTYPFMHEILEKAYEIGAITSDESNQIRDAFNKTKQRDFNSIYNPVKLT